MLTGPRKDCQPASPLKISFGRWYELLIQLKFSGHRLVIFPPNTFWLVLECCKLYALLRRPTTSLRTYQPRRQLSVGDLIVPAYSWIRLSRRVMTIVVSASRLSSNQHFRIVCVNNAAKRLASVLDAANEHCREQSNERRRVDLRLD